MRGWANRDLCNNAGVGILLIQSYETLRETSLGILILELCFHMEYTKLKTLKRKSGIHPV